MLLIKLLTVAHVVIHIGNKGYIQGSLKYYNFKTSKNPSKFWKVYEHIAYLERKAYDTTRSPFTPNIYVRSMNEWLEIRLKDF